MRLGRVPHGTTAAVVPLGQGRCQAVEAEADAPIPHLNKEGELLEDARVDVGGEPARVGRLEGSGLDSWERRGDSTSEKSSSGVLWREESSCIGWERAGEFSLMMK